MAIWHLITSEYPPQFGGVSDYTCQLARSLAERGGNQVHVWCPPHPSDRSISAGITIHADLGKYRAKDLRELSRKLNQFPGPRRLLVQWVPHGYGFYSMNLGFCLWLWNRAARHGDKVELMVHEPFLGFGEGSWRQNIPAALHRLMTMILLRAAERVWVSIPEWERRLRPWALGRNLPFQWLPIPSNVPVMNDVAAVQTVRRRYGMKDGLLIGHFGTYGRPVVSLLEPILLALGQHSIEHTILLMGIGSEAFRQALLQKKPELASQIRATGGLTPEDLSSHVAACDVLIQPYLDGVSTRRTSLMAGLAHGRAIVTTTGRATEPLWATTGSVALAPTGDVNTFVGLVSELCVNENKRTRMGDSARELYQERFDISHTIAAFQQADEREPACAF